MHAEPAPTIERPSMSDLVDSDVSTADEPGCASRRRRVQLSDLPHEIKELIVQHCHGADYDINCTIQSLVKRGGLPADSDCSLDDLRKRYRRTVAVLYEVSKEWQALCAPYRFEKLSTTKVADDFFQLVIARTHGHHFVSVKFNATASEAIIQFIKALPLLPNLRTFDLTLGLLHSLDGLDVLDDLDDLNSPLRRVVKERLILGIANGARHLSLDIFPVDDVFTWTARAPNVTHLSLVMTTSLMLDDFWSIITPMTPKLQIDFHDISPEQPLQFAALLDKQPAVPPALKSLVVFGYLALDSLPGFVAVFASTLRALTIAVGDLSLKSGVLQPLMPACSFPHLQTLLFELPEILLQITLNALPGSLQLPELRQLTVLWDSSSLSTMSAASFEKLLADYPDIKSVCLSPYRGGHRLSLLNAFGPRNKEGSAVVLERAPPKYPLLAMTDTDELAERLQHDTAREQRQSTLAAIDSVLEYATERRKRIVATEDWVDAARFVKDLGRLDLERMIHCL